MIWKVINYCTGKENVWYSKDIIEKVKDIAQYNVNGIHDIRIKSDFQKILDLLSE